MSLDAMPNSSEVGLSRVERKRTRKMRDILMAAAEVLNRDGYHAMTLDDVAERWIWRKPRSTITSAARTN